MMAPFGAEPVPSKKQTLLRWLRSARQRDIEIRSFQLFWHVRQRKETAVFRIRRFFLGLKTSLDEGRQWNSSRLLLFRTFLLPFLGAAAFVAAIEVPSHYAADTLAWTGQYLPSWTTAPFWIHASQNYREGVFHASDSHTLGICLHVSGSGTRCSCSVCGGSSG